MVLCSGDQPIETWTDVEERPLETRLGDIAVAIDIASVCATPVLSTIVNGC